MVELFWTLLGVLSVLGAVVFVVLAASNTDKVTSAAMSFVIALWFVIAAAFCAGYKLDVLLWPVDYPLQTAGVLTVYLLLGLLYSFVRWWSIVFRIRQARAEKYKAWLTEQFNRERKSLIYKLCDSYMSHSTADAPIAPNCYECKSVTDLQAVMNEDNWTFAKLLNAKPSNLTLAYIDFFVGCEANGEINFLVASGATILPKDWRAKWNEYLSYNGYLTGLEGMSQQHYRLNKPAIADNSSLVASWIAVWPACLVVNSVLNIGQTISTAALGLVDKLRGVYNRITASAWREE